MCFNNHHNAQYMHDFGTNLSRTMRKHAILNSTATALCTKSAMFCAYCGRVLLFSRAYDVCQVYAHMRNDHHSYGRVWADGVLDDTQAEGRPLNARVRVSAGMQQQLEEGGEIAKRGAGYVGRVRFSAVQQSF
ncbi:hypothetical protein EV121DRAFT_218859 [Schizophyllum commune]